LVAQAGELPEQIRPVGCKFARRETGNILEKHCWGRKLLHNLESGWEHIALIISPKLLACHAERRTWHAGSEEINAAEVRHTDVPNIRLHNIPMRPVLAQRCTKLRLVFDRARMMKASHFQPQRLATSPGT
jgi:hypothetical protein